MVRCPDASYTVGEQNLHDEYGKPTAFADIVFFCEAIAPTIRERLSLWETKHRALVCKQQRDLVLVLPWPDFKVEDKVYLLAHKGIAKVTPHRGIFLVKTTHRPTGRKVAFITEHRINSWWKAERGEMRLRSALWHKHTTMTLNLIDALESDGYTIIAGGDLNVPPDVQGYMGHLTEVSTSLDRIGVTKDVTVGELQRLSRVGSDHHRILTTVQF